MIDQKKIKTYSLIGARATFGMYALDLIKENPNLLILSIIEGGIVIIEHWQSLA